MDEYREQARRQQAVPLAAILTDFKNEEGPQQYSDGQRVTVAGIISSVRTKTTKNNSLMAYVGLEDDTASMELLCFSRVLGDSGAYLKAGVAVAVQGKISVRDEKEPQLMVDRVLPLGEPEGCGSKQTLWAVSYTHLDVYKRQGFGPSGEGYIRVTAFGDAEDTRQAVERIGKILR